MGWCAREGTSVTDRSGVTYRLGAEIDRGGQGIVFRTEADGAAVKISFRDSDAIENQIRAVARLPISDLPVALPRHTLKPPAVGYTMTHLTGMVGASSLANSPRREQFHEWYCRTGGVRKRLAVAAQLADIVSSLHARGLVYGDISANNTMVSEAVDRNRVYLIDLDNLASTLDPPKRIFTPAYAAPEQRSLGTSQSTDAFSLATVVYALVAATNPFYGRRLDDLPPEEFEDEPWALQCPWIEDPDDPSNTWPFGAPDQVPPRLRDLLGKAFTVGRNGCAADL